MALSEQFIDRHIARQRERLTSEFYPHRKHWPGRLFHHAPIENAVAILRDSFLRSRNDDANLAPRDVAAPGVIDARTHAHDSVRMYFRPKTPTQWHIEGIRKPGECTYGNETHAGVFVMFALDAKTILMNSRVTFSNQNMQLGSTTPGNTENYFQNIDFEKVYHEGTTGGDRSITDTRCAEVMVPSPLPLEDCLKAIYLRSDPEQETLLHLLGDQRERWAPFCQVSDNLKVFQKDYTFVQVLRLSGDGVVFRLNPRKDRRTIKIQINVYDSSGRLVANFFNNDHAAHPSPPFDEWIWERSFNDGLYIVEIFLEDTLAYRAHLQLGDALF